MKANFHPYQVDAIERMLREERVNLWLPMGAGKSLAVLTAVVAMRIAGVGPVLVLAPKRVAVNVWPAEIKKWDHLQHLRVSPIIGTAAQRVAALNRRADVYTINYDNVPWLRKQLGDAWPFEVVVADESTRLKNYRTRQGGVRSKALAEVAWSRTRRFINLTGTPSPNGLKDLWGQNWFIDQGKRLGSTYTAFTDRWFTTIMMGGGARSHEPRAAAMQEIPGKIADVTLSVDMRDYIDTHEPVRVYVEVELPPAAWQVYDDMAADMVAQLKSMETIEAVHGAARTIKCLQITSGFAFTEGGHEEIHDAKLDALESIVEELAGAPLLVAYHFKPDLARILKRFPQAREISDKNIDLWNAGKLPMMLCHPASAGHGLNLQDGGHHLAFYGLWWSLEEHQQIIERIGPVRQAQSGFDRPVYLYYILARDTIDHDVLTVLDGKATVQEVLKEKVR